MRWREKGGWGWQQESNSSSWRRIIWWRRMLTLLRVRRPYVSLFFFNQLLTVFIILRRQVTGHSMLHVAHAVSTLSPYWMSLFTVSGPMNSFCSTWTKTEFTFEFISEPNGRIGVASASRNWIEIWNNLAFFLNELCTESSENEYCTFKVISKYGSSRENAAGALYALIRHRCKSEFL